MQCAERQAGAHNQRNIQKNIRINTHDILDYKFSKNVRKPISNIKWWVCSSLACLLKQSNTLLLYNTERERAQDRATEQGSGF